MADERRYLDWGLLIVAVLAEAVVLYFVRDAAARLSLGLFLLAPVLWASARLGVDELLASSSVQRVHQRRFVRLRSQVQQLLDEIRRLNWMAVDAERGFRSREAALEEMDAIEGRLKEIIEDIRTTAGQMSPAGGDFEDVAESGGSPDAGGERA